MTTVEQVDQVKASLDKYGWIKHSYGYKATGICLGHAIDLCKENELMTIFIEVLPTPYTNVVEFNDDVCTDLEEVHRIIQKVRERVANEI